MYYQNEKVLMRHLGLLKEVELTTVIERKILFEGTEKQINAKCKQLIDSDPDVVYVDGEYL